MKRESVMPRGDRRVCREDGGAPNLFEGALKAFAAFKRLAHALDHKECRMPFIHVPHRRIVAEHP